MIESITVMRRPSEKFGMHSTRALFIPKIIVTCVILVYLDTFADLRQFATCGYIIMYVFLNRIQFAIQYQFII